MLENLIETLPAERVDLLRQELALLQRTADRFFLERRSEYSRLPAILREWGEPVTGSRKRGEPPALFEFVCSSNPVKLL
jgi:hypothetical protein